MSGDAGQASGQPAVQAAAEAAPRLQIVRGDASPEEIAALVAVLTARAAAAAAARAGSAPRPVSTWAARSRLVRGPVVSGPGAWRATAWPS